MIASEARAAASRANSLKSTGPRTEEGKAASRANSYKHGMTGAGVALPPHDAAEVARRAAAFASELNARGEVQAALARQAALVSFRLEKFAVAEAEATAARVRNAEEEFDEDRQLEADRLMRELAADPAATLRNLRRMPEGVDRLVAAWSSLRQDLGREGRWSWGAERHRLMIALVGRRPDSFGSSRPEALVKAMGGDFSHLDPEEVAGLDPAEASPWGRARLIGWIDAEIRSLQAHRATLDEASIAADRAGAPARALIDHSGDGDRSRRYEVAAARALHRALEDLQALQKAEAARKVNPEPRALPSASFGTQVPGTESRRGIPAPRSPAPPSTPASGGRPNV